MNFGTTHDFLAGFFLIPHQLPPIRKRGSSDHSGIWCDDNQSNGSKLVGEWNKDYRLRNKAHGLCIKCLNFWL